MIRLNSVFVLMCSLEKGYLKLSHRKPAGIEPGPWLSSTVALIPCTDLVGEAGGLGEHVEVTAGERKGHGLLHFNGDSLFLLVNIGGLSKLDVASSDVSGSRKFDTLL